MHIFFLPFLYEDGFNNKYIIHHLLSKILTQDVWLPPTVRPNSHTSLSYILNSLPSQNPISIANWKRPISFTTEKNLSFKAPKMWFLPHFFRLCIALFLVLGVGQANGQLYRKDGIKKLPYYTITVAQSGSASFSTIQSAIDSIPSNNRNWVCIRIKAGIYR